ncbi:MAG TPA: transcription termination factor Rho [Acidimicrobiales bacterium]|nr:transcription termination factor Rho [Acidimicrobiales bacterium]
MSVGSQELDRSVLERKEREALVSIAEALGKKPPSRARKGDIVDLILQLAGVEEPAGDAAPEAAVKPRRGARKDDTADGTADGAVDTDGAVPSVATNGAATEGAPSNHDASDHDEPGHDGSRADEAADDAGEGARFSSNGSTSSRGDDGGDADERATASSDASAEDGDRSHDRGDRGDRGDSQGQGGRGNQGGQGQQRNQNQGGQNQGGQNQNRNKGNRNGQNQGGQGGGQGGQGQGGQNQNRGEEPEPGNRRRRRRGRGGERERGPVEEWQGEPVEVEGMLDLRDEGYGFLRLKGYLSSKDDVYVSVKQVRQFGLRKGDILKGAARPATRNEKNPALLRIDTVNAGDPEVMRKRPRFEDLTPLFPDQRLTMESPADPTNMTARIIDLVCPIGKGQRGLIVSPPKAGKTTVMKQIAHSIELNSPEVHLMVLLVDERPEEVTDFRRSLTRGEVIASTFDRPSDEHTQVAELVIERAKRRVEDGQDVVIMLDGITRLSRAYNLAAPATGRIMSGGIDTGALYPPKKFFGAARNLEEGGSLTILATALVETGSKMDEVIFEEFKGTGNMELRLDRRLAERRIYPAIDVDASSTRHEELLFERKQLQQAWRLRRVLSGLASDGGTSAAGLEMLIDRLKTFKTNEEFLAEVAKAPTAAG